VFRGFSPETDAGQSVDESNAMRLPVDWIREYVPNDLSLKDLADVLTNVGLEVEAVEAAGGTSVFDIKVTSNRGDCLSVLGVARELAVALRREAVEPARVGQACPEQSRRKRVSCPCESGPPASTLVSVKLDDRGLCPRYSARIVRKITIGPSPAWAQRRLELCGMRPISNVVDATNLVMLELGQPLHAFDYALLRSHEGSATPSIIVRRAKPGERLVTIDGEERTLTPDVLVIADPKGAIALAGIMGGSSSEIHGGTTEVLLESAHFDPSTIRRGARLLQMSTEASYRFERSVDPGGTVRALDRVCQLIAEFSPEPVEIAQGVVDAYPKPIRETTIRLRPKRANALLGVNLTADEMAEHLRRLQLDVTGKGALRVKAPTFRQDLKEEIDLVEEVARACGYHNIPEALPRSSAGVGRLPAEMRFEREVRAIMLGLGLSESVTSSLEGPDALPKLRITGDHPLARPVTINNAKTADRSQLRTTLITSLLDVVAHNRRHGVSNVGLFDLGRVYWSRGDDELPDQPQHLGIAGSGALYRGRWAAKDGSEKWDFYALKGMIETVIQRTALRSAEYTPHADHYLQPGRAARVQIGDDVIGHFGELAAAVRDAYDLPDPVYVAEMDLDLLRAHAAAPSFTPFGRYPAMTRDVAFLVSRDIPAQRAEAVIWDAAGGDLESVTLFDAYEGTKDNPLPPGQRNLAFSLTFRNPERTLTDEEVEAHMTRIRTALREGLGAGIRE
jgi:phenylalanyl-tRNA synthetase beta chain